MFLGCASAYASHPCTPSLQPRSRRVLPPAGVCARWACPGTGDLEHLSVWCRLRHRSTATQVFPEKPSELLEGDMNAKQYLTRREVTETCNVAYDTARRWEKAGSCPTPEHAPTESSRSPSPTWSPHETRLTQRDEPGTRSCRGGSPFEDRIVTRLRELRTTGFQCVIRLCPPLFLRRLVEVGEGGQGGAIGHRNQETRGRVEGAGG